MTASSFPASVVRSRVGRWLVALAVALCAVAALLPRAAHAAFDSDAIYHVPDDDAPAAGSAEAPITIVEFSDYACAFCVRARATLEALALLYPGQLRVVHRLVPYLSPSDLPAQAAREAALQGKHRAMEARLYGVAGRVDRAGIELLATELGLDLGRLRAALDAGTHRAAVGRDVELAQRLGVTSTPTFFVNGRAIVGARPLAAFVEVIDEELRRAAVTSTASGLTGRALYAELIAGGRKGGDDAPTPPSEGAQLSQYSRYRVGAGWPGLSRGPAEAPVTIVVFSDFECPYCAANEAALAHVRERFGESVRVVFRHFPLPFHRRAQLAAEAAMAAAAQGKFWPFHDRLFAAPGQLDREQLIDAARAVGLELGSFAAALDTRAHREAVLLDMASGAAHGIDGTPTMFVNGVVIPGAASPEHLASIVKGQLDAAAGLVAAGLERGDIYSAVMRGARGAERADPSTIPLPRAARALQLSADERLLVVTAACRRRERLRTDVASLPPAQLAIARAVCAPYGAYGL